MNKSAENKALLPSGFEDLLPPQARMEFKAISDLMSVFQGFGYERVKPPLAEFEDSLLAPGPGAALAPDTFRLMDPDSRKMMALRSDITAQIARISLSRLSDEKRPLRLAYANDVIRTQGSQQRTQRQFCQIGCEIVGVDSAQADIEICVMALMGLSRLGLGGVSVDFALPKIAASVLEAANPDGKDIDAVRHELAGPVDKALGALDGLKLSAEEQAHVARLKEVVEGVQKALDELEVEDVSLTIDPLETHGFEYHSGVAFTMFADGVRGELGRGGRYMIFGEGEQKESANGFTLYADAVRQGLPELPELKVEAVSADTSWAEIASLQDKGIVVLRDV